MTIEANDAPGAALQIDTADRVAFVVNGSPVTVRRDHPHLLAALREELNITSPKDGCSPSGQCGCCTVLVDGEARVSCVTPVDRIIGRTVTTAEGLEPVWRDACAASFVATGGSQCGFCTPGIIVRCASAVAKGRVDRASMERALAAHVCRCTGWQSVLDALESPVALDPSRDLSLAAERAVALATLGSFRRDCRQRAHCSQGIRGKAFRINPEACNCPGWIALVSDKRSP